ncbi:ornithine cyclodeaminase family protein [Myxococcus sp. CA051A]|uniref:ornithine cyclodeaminase family protein n=1 Tax=unclassified Myxococcus TaxID=2648731 RepID=UPI00157B7204|nr:MULTISPECIES: ornithine cyclodeaminase family protein [unclassified Myxococcus]NTX11021.1 ornithine cyclodeaminase family protein [Myxococcus sp. CA056]NTX40882.1 ornithine cyclodeaminase family protein [Myxococcus sp. CA033]NTX50473.1 ornithine cyclodeaminase family protein [Myxococcus sp. CA039A]NTX60296.1 ornithine cyclodeaminase family protein [Myxococcus sp. CA051A]
MRTLLLTRSDVSRNLQALTLLEDLRESFRTDALARTVAPQRVRASLHAEGTVMALLPGCLPGIPAYTVKVHAKFPSSTPAIQGVLHLNDLATGELLAVMDSGHLTAVRTGVMGALAADVLARPDASRVAIIGAGAQAVMQLKSLRLVRSLSHVRVYDTDPTRAFAFATRMYKELNLPVRPEDSVADAVADADIVIAATWSRQPFLHPGMVRPGTHVTTLGADEPGKAEVSAELLRQARFICDHRGLSVTSGAVGNVGLGEDAIHAELGEVIAGLKPGRTSPQEVTVFGAVGLPFQDLAAAWHVYQAARGDDAIQGLDFSA